MEASNIDINIDGKWSLEDFSVMSKNYIQSYSFIYSLSDLELPRPDYEIYRNYFKS
jgi:hypothetical protein